MAAGKISIQANDGKVAGIVFEDGASSNVTVTVPKEGGEFLTTEGAQTKNGVMTFTDSPVVPTPTTDTQAVNKNYADLKVALASFVGTNQSLGGSGYQKLPGGLIIQWGSVTLSANGDVAVTLPIAFTTACFTAYCTYTVRNAYEALAITAKSTTSITVDNGDNYTQTIHWLAIGY